MQVDQDSGARPRRNPRFADEDVFAAVRRRYRSREPRQREAQAVLEAVTAVVLDFKGAAAAAGPDGKVAVSPTEYFAALMTPLATLAQEEQPDPAVLGATVYLVQVVFPSVPAAVLQRQVQALAEVFTALLSRHTDDQLVCRHVLGCAGTLLRQIHPKQWADQGVRRLLQALLVFSIDPRAHVRRVSKQGAARALASVRPMSRQVGDALAFFVDRELGTCTQRELQVALHVCGLLQAVLPVLPPSVASTVLQPVLRLTATAANPLLTVQAMRTVHCLANADRSNDEHWEGLGDDERRRCDDLVARVADAMPQLQPSVADAQAITAYLAAGSSVVQRLRRHRDPLQLITRLPRFCEQATAALLSDKAEAVEAATSALQAVLEACVTPEMVEQALVSRRASARAAPTALESVLVTVTSLLTYRYKAVWNHVFGVIKSLFRSMDARAFPLMVDVLEGLDALRGSEDPGNNWDYHKHLDEAIGAAIASAGPHLVLQALPLNLPSLKTLEGQTVAEAVVSSRSWMLPLLKAHTDRCYINFFGQSLVPMANRLAAEAVEAEAQGRPVAAKTLRDMGDQVWSAFPSFCRYPADLLQALKAMAPRLGKMLSDPACSYAHQHICHGLEALVRFRQRAAQAAERAAAGEAKAAEDANATEEERWAAAEAKAAEDSDDDDEEEEERDQGLGAGAKFTEEEQARAPEELKAMATYARQFMPLLLNILSETPAEQSGVVLNAIQAWASVAEPDAISTLLKACVRQVLVIQKRVEQAGAGVDADEVRRLRTYVDSTVYLAPHASAADASILHRTLRPFLQASDAGLQKKAYKAVGALCRHGDEFFAASWEAVVDDLLASMASLKAAAARNRLLCLREIVVRVPDLLQNPKVLQVLPQILGEVILSVKDNSSKVHDAAYHVLLSLADRMLKMPAPAGGAPAPGLSAVSAQSEQPYITELMMMICAGLTRTPEMQAASLKSLACIVHSYREELPLGVVAGLLGETLNLLQTTKAREVVSGVLSYVKVCCVYMEPDTLQPLLATLVAGLTTWNEAAGTRFRSRIKKILHILLKKVGVQPLRALVPSSHAQLVEYLHKMNEREMRKKAERREQWLAKRRARGEMEDDADMGGASERAPKSSRSLRAHVADFHRVAGRDGDKDDEADSDDESDSDDEAAHAAGNRRAAAGPASQLYISNQDVDFMDQGVLRHVVTHDPKEAARRARRKAAEAAKIETNEEGKLVIPGLQSDSDDDVDEAEGELELQDLEEQASLGLKQRRGKRSRDAEAEAPARRGKGGRKGGRAAAAEERGPKRQRKGANKSVTVAFGPDLLNKRAKHRTARHMESVIKAAKKGSLAGSKTASKQRGRRSRQQ